MLKRILIAIMMVALLTTAMTVYNVKAEQADCVVTVEAGAPSSNWRYAGNFRTTGYCPCRKCCGKWSGGPTASGAMPTAGHTIAASASDFPFGTKVWINGKIYTVEDRGVGSGCIDIFYDDHETAKNHGFQYYDVYVMR